MRMVKVIITVSVCILMVLTLFGCNSENDNNNNSDLLTIYVVNESPIIRLIDAYNDSNKSDKINVVEIQDGDTLNSKLSAELMAGKGPDIVLYDSSYNGISNMEKMMALDVFADYNELIKNDSSDSSIDLKNYNEVVQEFTMVNAILCQYHICLIS